MASSKDVPILKTDKGAKVHLGKLYLYPDGHANLTFPAVKEIGFEGANLPLTNAVDVLLELNDLVKRMQDQVVTKRPEA